MPNFYRQVDAGEVISIAFDFADFLERNGYPAATFTPLIEAGVTLLQTRVVGSVITLTLFCATQNQSLMVGARADAGTDLTDSLFKLLYVRAAVVPEPIEPPVIAGTVLTSAAGEILVNAAGELLLIE